MLRLDSSPWWAAYQDVIDITDTQPDPAAVESITTHEDSPGDLLDGDITSSKTSVVAGGAGASSCAVAGGAGASSSAVASSAVASHVEHVVDDCAVAEVTETQESASVELTFCSDDPLIDPRTMATSTEFPDYNS